MVGDPGRTTSWTSFAAHPRTKTTAENSIIRVDLIIRKELGEEVCVWGKVERAGLGLGSTPVGVYRLFGYKRRTQFVT